MLPERWSSPCWSYSCSEQHGRGTGRCWASSTAASVRHYHTPTPLRCGPLRRLLEATATARWNDSQSSACSASVAAVPRAHRTATRWWRSGSAVVARCSCRGDSCSTRRSIRSLQSLLAWATGIGNYWLRGVKFSHSLDCGMFEQTHPSSEKAKCLSLQELVFPLLRWSFLHLERIFSPQQMEQIVIGLLHQARLLPPPSLLLRLCANDSTCTGVYTKSYFF